MIITSHMQKIIQIYPCLLKLLFFKSTPVLKDHFLSPRDSGEGYSNSGCLSIRHTFLFTR
jgi:hypothetical protein